MRDSLEPTLVAVLSTPVAYLSELAWRLVCSGDPGAPGIWGWSRAHPQKVSSITRFSEDEASLRDPPGRSSEQRLQYHRRFRGSQAPGKPGAR